MDLIHCRWFFYYKERLYVHREINSPSCCKREYGNAGREIGKQRQVVYLFRHFVPPSLIKAKEFKTAQNKNCPSLL